MHFTKAFVLLATALAPVAFAAQAASSPAVTQTVTLVPSGYTPPPSSTPTPTPTSTATPTPTSTMTPSSTSTPVYTSTPCSSSISFSRVYSSSTPLIKPTSVPQPSTPAVSAPASTSVPTSGAAQRQLPGVMAAGAMAVAGFLLV